jgi:hypothetical protein
MPEGILGQVTLTFVFGGVATIPTTADPVVANDDGVFFFFFLCRYCMKLLLLLLLPNGYETKRVPLGAEEAAEHAPREERVSHAEMVTK